MKIRRHNLSQTDAFSMICISQSDANEQTIWNSFIVLKKNFLSKSEVVEYFSFFFDKLCPPETNYSTVLQRPTPPSYSDTEGTTLKYVSSQSPLRMLSCLGATAEFPQKESIGNRGRSCNDICNTRYGGYHVLDPWEVWQP